MGIVIYFMVMFYIFKLFRTTNDVNLDYQSCVEDGGKVVSHVFCLPNSYRKDVLPPTGLYRKYKILNHQKCPSKTDMSL